MTTKSDTPFEVGQTLYVSVTGWFMHDKEPKLHEYVITRFNKTSIYAKSKEFPDHRETRFTIRTMEGSNVLGYTYHAYTDPDVYWRMIERAKQKKNLKEELTKFIQELSLEDLKKVKNFVEENKM